MGGEGGERRRRIENLSGDTHASSVQKDIIIQNGHLYVKPRRCIITCVLGYYGGSFFPRGLNFFVGLAVKTISGACYLAGQYRRVSTVSD